MGNDICEEEVTSWSEGGLDPLIAKYRPQLIMLDYMGGARGWLGQLEKKRDWRLIYVDEVVAVYAHRRYSPRIPAVDLRLLPQELGLAYLLGNGAVERILQQPAPAKARRLAAGFVRRQVREHYYDRLGYFCMMTGAFGAAERLYLECLKNDPDIYYDIYSELGSLYLNTGRHEKALLCYNQFLSYNPGRKLGAYNDRAIVKYELADFDGAIGDFDRAAEMNPENVITLCNRALAKEAAHDFEGALGDYARALEIDPAHQRARQGMNHVRRLLP